jgi:hypothetical protein
VSQADETGYSPEVDFSKTFDCLTVSCRIQPSGVGNGGFLDRLFIFAAYLHCVSMCCAATVKGIHHVY